ncbi:MAG: adenylyltransferase/cytidyltransferase family protein, partial [Leptospiraceae bacterium]|nr:adenylyltransferase/cytidyltransferase family protein [Leptospiraceae bacterium]
MKTNGLILGKFYPFHNGHKYLIEEALKRCDHLTVLVCSLKRETIDGKLRYKWVKETFPNVNVIHVTDENPQYPEEHPDFWEIWKATIQRAHPEPIHVLFTSEYYGNPLSQVLSCRHECI